MKAYILNDDNTSGKEITQEDLNKIGVLHWKLDADNYEKEGLLDKIRSERNYNYTDFVSISYRITTNTLQVNSNNIPDLPSKLAIFFEE